VFSEILAKATENLLQDDSHKLSDHCDRLRKKGGGNVDIIVDNAGFELVTDLALAQYLVQSGIAKVVTFQLKSHPTFVSDALEKDLLETVNYYSDTVDATKYPSCVAAGTVWKEYLNTGAWKCSENNFWVQPFPMWQMTEPLRSEMRSRCDLAFVKGDANYRRLLGDLQWDLTASFDDVVGCSFPVPLCALRTLKAELGCGMPKEQIERAAALDPHWMTNGRFGVVQFGLGASQ
jgi:Damage-control phosphatase ARMT1-like domain